MQANESYFIRIWCIWLMCRTPSFQRTPGSIHCWLTLKSRQMQGEIIGWHWQFQLTHLPLAGCLHASYSHISVFKWLAVGCIFVLRYSCRVEKFFGPQSWSIDISGPNLHGLRLGLSRTSESWDSRVLVLIFLLVLRNPVCCEYKSGIWIYHSHNLIGLLCIYACVLVMF